MEEWRITWMTKIEQITVMMNTEHVSDSPAQVVPNQCERSSSKFVTSGNLANQLTTALL